MSMLAVLLTAAVHAQSFTTDDDILAPPTAEATSEQAADETKEVMPPETVDRPSDPTRPREANTGEVADDEDAASPVPSPWVAAMWLPLRDRKPPSESVDGEGDDDHTLGLDFGLGAALHVFDPERHPRLWRLVPAALTIGRESIALGPAWIISARDAPHVTAIGGGLGVPWDTDGLYWRERERVVGITRTMDFGGGDE